MTTGIRFVAFSGISCASLNIMLLQLLYVPAGMVSTKFPPETATAVVRTAFPLHISITSQKRDGANRPLVTPIAELNYNAITSTIAHRLIRAGGNVSWLWIWANLIDYGCRLGKLTEIESSRLQIPITVCELVSEFLHGIGCNHAAGLFRFFMNCRGDLAGILISVSPYAVDIAICLAATLLLCKPIIVELLTNSPIGEYTMAPLL